jgi:hypothetical protein
MAGLRLTSGPFDWIGHGDSVQKVLKWCMTDFSGFFEKDDLVRMSEACGPRRTYWYINKATGFVTAHDFVYGRPFDEMYEEVKARFDRRIKRFTDALKGNERVVLCWLARDVPFKLDPFNLEETVAAFLALRAKYGDHIDLLCFLRDPSADPAAPRVETPVEGLRIVSFFTAGYSQDDLRIDRDEEKAVLAELARYRAPGGKLSNRWMSIRKWIWRSKISRKGNQTFRFMGIPVWRRKV